MPWKFINEPLSERFDNSPAELPDESSDTVQIQVGSTCLAVAKFRNYGSTGLGFAGNGVLIVRFVKDGRVYQYNDFPLAEFQSLRVAGSKGGFFNRNIRTEYDYEEIFTEGEE